MTDPLSVTSSIIALVGFALQTSKTLYTLVDSFKTNRRNIRELREELESLQEVLQSLKRLATENEEDLRSLKLPLYRCGMICEEFADVIEKCTAHSQESRTSFRDWTKLQYRGDDITKFKLKLSDYKATISIALASATFRTVTSTTNVLKEHKDLVDNTSNVADIPRANAFENITSGDSSHQLIVSTVGDLITAKQVSTGSGSAQWFGQMSDETIRYLADNHTQVVERENREPGGAKIASFGNQYGVGHQLNSEKSRVNRNSSSR